MCDLTIGIFVYILEPFTSSVRLWWLYFQTFVLSRKWNLGLIIYVYLGTCCLLLSFKISDTAHKVQQLCKTQACCWAEGVPVTLGCWNEWLMLSAGPEKLITCFLCTRKRRAYENRSHVPAKWIWSKNGNVDLRGQTIKLLTKYLLCFLVYITLIISLIRIWHCLNAVLLSFVRNSSLY